MPLIVTQRTTNCDFDDTKFSLLTFIHFQFYRMRRLTTLFRIWGKNPNLTSFVIGIQIQTAHQLTSKSLLASSLSKADSLVVETKTSSTPKCSGGRALLEGLRRSLIPLEESFFLKVLFFFFKKKKKHQTPIIHQ